MESGAITCTPMKLEIIDNHSVALDLLTKGPVLDAGCRGFRFSEYFAKLGHTVVMMDPSPDTVVPTKFQDFPAPKYFFPQALVAPDAPRSASLRMTDDAEARHVVYQGIAGDPAIRCMSINEVMDQSSVKQWDLVKLNIEGSEYGILRQWPGPIARQVVVSFHEHTNRRMGDTAIQEIMDHLAKWYVPIRHEFDERYCAGRNAWDSVVCLRELA